MNGLNKDLLRRLVEFIKIKCLLLNFCYVYIDVFNTIIGTMIYWTYEVIHFRPFLILGSNKCFGTNNASLGDLPLAKYAAVAAECTTGTVVVALLEHICC